MRIAIVAAAFGLLVAGCGATAGPAATPEPADSGSAAPFAAALSKGYDADYDPLAAPRDAIEQSALIVHGRVVEVFEGLSVTYPDPEQTAHNKGTFVTLRLMVIEVLSATGQPPVTGSSVYLQVRKSPGTPLAEIARVAIQAGAVAILGDISGWTPVDGATVTRPPGVPTTGPLYLAFPDGLWLQGSSDPTMIGVGSDLDDLPPAWGDPRTLDQLIAAIKSARW